MNYTHEDLIKMDGVKITCDIARTHIDDAMILVEKNCVYVCQDERGDRNIGRKTGYAYSWIISANYGKYETYNRDCTNITVVEEPEQETRLYTKYMTAEQIIANLKNGMAVKDDSHGKKEEYKLVDGFICLFLDGELSCIGSDIVTWGAFSYFEIAAPLKIKVGKFYKTRDGQKAYIGGKDENIVCGFVENKSYNIWDLTGKHDKNTASNIDLVAEWKD